MVRERRNLNNRSQQQQQQHLPPPTTTSTKQNVVVANDQNHQKPVRRVLGLVVVLSLLFFAYHQILIVRGRFFVHDDNITERRKREEEEAAAKKIVNTSSSSTSTTTTTSTSRTTIIDRRIREFVFTSSSSLRSNNNNRQSSSTTTTTHAGKEEEGTKNNNNNNNDDDDNNNDVIKVYTRDDRICRHKNAFVFLVQKKHSTYHGRNSFNLLLQTLDYFRDHYLLINNHYNNMDIFIFHTGDFDATTETGGDDLNIIEDRLLLSSSSNSGENNNNNRGSRRDGGGIVRMINLNNTVYWSLPSWLRNDDPNKWKGSEIYPIGYRHMCRFFAQEIWNFFNDLNNNHNHYNSAQQQQQSTAASSTGGGGGGCQYRHIARLDEDSFILSPIRYDMFDFMKTNEYVYGYRMCSFELEETLPKVWFKKWRRSLFLKNNNNRMNSNNSTTTAITTATALATGGSSDAVKQQQQQQQQQQQGRGGRWIDLGLCGFYTNFFITDLHFFSRPDVRKFLREIDKRGLYYRQRFGDLLVHTLAVYAFANSATDIHRFLDFTYQHVTIDHFKDPHKQCLSWGAIQAGYNDDHLNNNNNNNNQRGGDDIIDQFYNTHVLQKDCPMSANMTYIPEEDLSPTYSHIPDEIRNKNNNKKIALKTVHAGKVELPGQGILSG